MVCQTNYWALYLVVYQCGMMWAPDSQANAVAP
jgi:hypothetical protein